MRVIKNNIYARKYYTSLNKIFPFFKFRKVNYSNYIENRIINFWVGKETKIKECFKINKLINHFYKNAS